MSIEDRNHAEAREARRAAYAARERARISRALDRHLEAMYPATETQAARLERAFLGSGALPWRRMIEGYREALERHVASETHHNSDYGVPADDRCPASLHIPAPGSRCVNCGAEDVEFDGDYEPDWGSDR